MKVPLKHPAWRPPVPKRITRLITPSSEDNSWSRKRTAPSVFMPRKRPGSSQLSESKNPDSLPPSTTTIKESEEKKTLNESDKSPPAVEQPSLLKSSSSHDEEKENVHSTSSKEVMDKEMTSAEEQTEKKMTDSEKTLEIVGTEESIEVQSSEPKKDDEDKEMTETFDATIVENESNGIKASDQGSVLPNVKRVEMNEDEVQKTAKIEAIPKKLSSTETESEGEKKNDSDISSDLSDLSDLSDVEMNLIDIKPKRVKLTTAGRKKAGTQLTVKLNLKPKHRNKSPSKIKAIEFPNIKDVEQYLLNEELSDENLNDGEIDSLRGNGDDIFHVLSEVLGFQSKEHVPDISPAQCKTETENIFHSEPSETSASTLTGERKSDEIVALEKLSQNDLLISKMSEAIGMESRRHDDLRVSFNVDLDASFASSSIPPDDVCRDEKPTTTKTQEEFSRSDVKLPTSETVVESLSDKKRSTSKAPLDFRRNSLPVLESNRIIASKSRKLLRQRSLSGQFLAAHLGSQSEESFYTFTSDIPFPMLSPLRDESEEEPSSEPTGDLQATHATASREKQ